MLLRLEGAKRYVCRSIRTEPVLKGDVIEVADALGNKLLSETYLDRGDNERPVFVEVATGAEVVEEVDSGDDGDEDSAVAKPAPKRTGGSAKRRVS